MTAQVFLIPSLLHEKGTNSLPAYLLPAVKQCAVIFSENIRTTRRFLKQLDSTINIDGFEWYAIDNAEDDVMKDFKQHLKAGKKIAIISEAGCPGVADPGQKLINVAQREGVKVTPLVGPNAILLALMASGLNGQQFEFVGYLPIENYEREKRIRELEQHSQINQSTKICIETPYRNNKLFESFVKVCHPDTLLCIGVNLTGDDEQVITLPIKDWKKRVPDLHKKPVVFLWLKN